jgi:hypothetical protein
MKTNNDNLSVPPMPVMKWNENGSPKLEHLQDKKDVSDSIRLVPNTKQPDGSGVPDMPVMKWNGDGSPCTKLDR